MKIWIAIPAFTLAAYMTGCASSSPTLSIMESEMMSRELNEQIVNCTLPFLEAHAMAKATISYRYQDGSVTFSSDTHALAAHLGQCAMPSSGPDGTFEREIEIWSTDKQ
ncbi:hypothetical protein [Pandoraea pulmonicola]|uniref:Lipoprotein n=1 Tax=Pandoraea pulmonicola TaxID=93221 RepID=A0AAJ5CZX1_PANPU|nr:hypothetical protein [Pandoraea pulmonicola]AJC21251.1 hypothetical protein RO07_13535 [Pandoraea pulmonicola]SUA90053.1 Uncharacterised protein [Pandoraea pulmonicola]